MSGGLRWDQPAPRQWNAPMAGNPRNPAMSPHKQSSRHLSHWAKQWKKGKGRGGANKTGRITPSSATKTASIRHAETRYNAGGTEPAMPTADRWPLDKYQLLFVVNLVKLHLTAFNRTVSWCRCTGDCGCGVSGHQISLQKEYSRKSTKVISCSHR